MIYLLGFDVQIMRGVQKLHSLIQMDIINVTDIV